MLGLGINLSKGGAYNPLLDRLVAYYRMGEASGSRLDSSGSGLHLTDNNTVGSRTFKGAASFDGNNANYLSAADSAALSTGDIDFCFSAKVWLDNKTLTQTFFAKYGAAGQREFRLYYDIGNDRIRFAVSSDGTDLATVSANNYGSPQTGQWIYVFCYHNAATNEIGIQVNNGATDTLAHSAGVLDGTGEFSVGRAASIGSALTGKVDSLGFFKTVLAAGDRTTLYNGGVPIQYAELAAGIKTNLVAWWDLDARSGTRLDYHSTNHLAENGTVVAYFPYGYAAYFDSAQSEYLSVADNNLLRVLTDKTWIGWFRLDEKSVGRYIIHKGGLNTTTLGYRLDYALGTDRIRFTMGDGTALRNATSALEGSGASPVAGKWYFFWCQYVFSTRVASFSINNGPVSTLATLTADPVTTANPLTIGSRSDTPGEYWHGGIDEVAIYNRLLSAGEIAFFYNNGYRRAIF